MARSLRLQETGNGLQNARIAEPDRSPQPYSSGNGQLDILVTSDAGFKAHTATTIASVMAHNPRVRFHWIHENLSRRDKKRLARFVEARGHELHFYRIDEAGLKDLTISLHASAANYFRLQMGRLLPGDIDRIIYLDSDVIVRRSLHDLYDRDLEGNVIGAMLTPEGTDVSQKLGIDPADFFSSGVMVISLKAWRERDMERQCFEYIARNRGKLIYWDQDALNVVLNGKWTRLPMTFNAQRYFFKTPTGRLRYPEIVHNPAIVHFSGLNKPWNSSEPHEFRHEYKYFRRQTPWPFYFNLDVLSKKSIKNYFASKKTRQKKQQRRWLTDLFKSTPIYRIRKEKRNKKKAMGQERLAEEQRQLQVRTDNIIKEAFAGDLTVRTGCFRGMRYIDSAYYSALLPKIAGTYEQPIAGIVEDWQRRQPRGFIDIGCAEGFYAVGMLRSCKELVCHAFDISDQARRELTRLGRLNNVEDRLNIGGYCDHKTLSHLLGPGVVLFCDIEGSELELLEPTLVPGLLHTEILVETHDFILPGTTEALVSRFSDTHRIVCHMDCRRDTGELAAILATTAGENALTFIDTIIDERRPPGMRWLHMVPLDGTART